MTGMTANLILGEMLCYRLSETKQWEMFNLQGAIKRLRRIGRRTLKRLNAVSLT
jgi:hypothetical protein